MHDKKCTTISQLWSSISTNLFVTIVKFILKMISLRAHTHIRKRSSLSCVRFSLNSLSAFIWRLWLSQLDDVKTIFFLFYVINTFPVCTKKCFDDNNNNNKKWLFHFCMLLCCASIVSQYSIHMLNEVAVDFHKLFIDFKCIVCGTEIV